MSDWLQVDWLGDSKKARNKGLGLASGGGGRTGEFVLTPKLPPVSFYCPLPPLAWLQDTDTGPGEILPPRLDRESPALTLVSLSRWNFSVVKLPPCSPSRPGSLLSLHYPACFMAGSENILRALAGPMFYWSHFFLLTYFAGTEPRL